MYTANNKQRAIENEQQVLRAIGHVGWLSATQVASWVWPASGAHSARVSADKTLKRLLHKGFLKKRTSGRGTQVYVLTRTGAARANEGIAENYGLREGVKLFRDGYGLSQLDDERQRVAAGYLREQHNKGNAILGAASVRKAVEDEFFEEGMRGADGFVFDNESQETHAVLVVRNIHAELIEKAQRLQEAAGDIRLIGHTVFVKAMKKEIEKDITTTGRRC